MKSSMESGKESSGGSGALFATLFPWAELLLIALSTIPLSKFFQAHKLTVEQAWIKSAMKRHLAAAALLLALNAVAVGYLMADVGAGPFTKSKSTFSIKSALKMKTGKLNYNKVLEHPVFIFFVAQGFFGLLLNFSHPLIVERRRLKKVLVWNGFDPSTASQALWTPFGVYLNITGKAANEVAANKTIWDTLNMNVTKDSFLVNTSARTRVFFKNEFELAPTYNFEDEAKSIFKE
nr:hypothetical protein BdHM001_35720 [Bdellovibrio sp. HM001]